MDKTFAVQLQGITKRFPGVIANDQVDFDLKWGEVHALLGENGAGKSTLMNILCGLYYPDEGHILINEEHADIHSPRASQSYGIGMVHQHFMLARIFDVVENITAGSTEGGLFLNTREAAAQIEALGKKHGLGVDPYAKIWQLSVGEQQRVEILKLLYRGAEILILDEPTSVLTKQEADELFKAIRQMTSEGKAVIFISHKLDEVLDIADRITVLRQGQLVGTIPAENITKRELAQMMVGREFVFDIDREEIEPGEIVLALDQVKAKNEFGQMALKDVSLDIREHEIFGIAGVAGNGQKELAEVVSGMRAILGGKVAISGENLSSRNARWVIDSLGVSYIPEDRIHLATVSSLSLTKNAILKSYRKRRFNRSLRINWEAARDYTSKLVDQYNVKTPGISTRAGMLSGGNLQKLILAREVSDNPPLLIAVHPTYGLDVKATQYLREQILEQRRQGTAVLLISEDLEEILELSDRVGVIFDGQIMGVLDCDTARENLDQLGLMMAGSTEAAQVLEEA